MKRGVWLFVTVDGRRKLALLRGDGAAEAVRMLVPAEQVIYSKFGRGWVVPESSVADVVAFCEYRHELCVVHQRKAAAS